MRQPGRRQRLHPRIARGLAQGAPASGAPARASAATGRRSRPALGQQQPGVEHRHRQHLGRPERGLLAHAVQLAEPRQHHRTLGAQRGGLARQARGGDRHRAGTAAGSSSLHLPAGDRDRPVPASAHQTLEGLAVLWPRVLDHLGGQRRRRLTLPHGWPSMRTASSQSRRYCLSKLGGFSPAASAAAASSRPASSARSRASAPRPSAPARRSRRGRTRTWCRR